MTGYEWLLALGCVAGLFWLGARRQDAKDAVCQRCGGATVHYCGMACVDMCPRCDFGEK